MSNAAEIRPLEIAVASNGDNLAWHGPVKLVAYRHQGGAATATTVTIRDTSPAVPGGGTVLATFTVPATAPAGSFDLSEYRALDGLVVNNSQAIKGELLIKGDDAQAAYNPGKPLFEATVAAQSVTRLTGEASSTAYLASRARANRKFICNGTEPGIAVYNLNDNGFTPFTPTNQFRSLTLLVYLPSQAARYNNGAAAADGSANMFIRLSTSGEATRYQTSAAYYLRQGWNRIVVTRADFTADPAFGPDTWNTGTFSELSVLMYGGTALTEFYIDSATYNSSAAKPRVVFRFDDGFRSCYEPFLHFAEEYGIPISLFVPKAFITQESSTYMNADEVVALRERLGKHGLMYVGDHSATHTGPTALEALTLAQFRKTEVDVNVAWLLETGIWPNEQYPRHTVTPNGQYSPAIKAAYQAAGFKTLGTVLNNPIPGDGENVDPFSLPILNIPGTLSTPKTAGWDVHEKRIVQSGADAIILGHSLGNESGGEVFGGASTGLNVTPAEFRPIAARARELADAGLIELVTMDEYSRAMGWG